MGSLAQMSSGAIRCSFNTRFRTRFRRDLVKIPAEAPEGSVRFRRVPVQIPCEVPEGSGERPCEVPEGFGGEDAWWGSGRFRCRDLVRFRKVLAEKMLGEVPEGSGADTLWGSGGFLCRCFVKFQSVPIFLMAAEALNFYGISTFYGKNAEAFKLLGIAPEFIYFLPQHPLLP